MGRCSPNLPNSPFRRQIQNLLRKKISHRDAQNSVENAIYDIWEITIDKAHCTAKEKKFKKIKSHLPPILSKQRPPKKFIATISILFDPIYSFSVSAYIVIYLFIFVYTTNYYEVIYRLLFPIYYPTKSCIIYAIFRVLWNVVILEVKLGFLWVECGRS